MPSYRHQKSNRELWMTAHNLSKQMQTSEDAKKSYEMLTNLVQFQSPKIRTNQDKLLMMRSLIAHIAKQRQPPSYQTLVNQISKAFGSKLANELKASQLFKTPQGAPPLNEFADGGIEDQNDDNIDGPSSNETEEDDDDDDDDDDDEDEEDVDNAIAPPVGFRDMPIKADIPPIPKEFKSSQMQDVQSSLPNLDFFKQDLGSGSVPSKNWSKLDWKQAMQTKYKKPDEKPAHSSPPNVKLFNLTPQHQNEIGNIVAPLHGQISVINNDHPPKIEVSNMTDQQFNDFKPVIKAKGITRTLVGGITRIPNQPSMESGFQTPSRPVTEISPRRTRSKTAVSSGHAGDPFIEKKKSPFETIKSKLLSPFSRKKKSSRSGFGWSNTIESRIPLWNSSTDGDNLGINTLLTRIQQTPDVSTPYSSTQIKPTTSTVNPDHIYELMSESLRHNFNQSNSADHWNRNSIPKFSRSRHSRPQIAGLQPSDSQPVQDDHVVTGYSRYPGTLTPNAQTLEVNQAIREMLDDNLSTTVIANFTKGQEHATKILDVVKTNFANGTITLMNGGSFIRNIIRKPFDEFNSAFYAGFQTVVDRERSQTFASNILKSRYKPFLIDLSKKLSHTTNMTQMRGLQRLGRKGQGKALGNNKTESNILEAMLSQKMEPTTSYHPLSKTRTITKQDVFNVKYIMMPHSSNYSVIDNNESYLSRLFQSGMGCCKKCVLHKLRRNSIPTILIR